MTEEVRKYLALQKRLNARSPLKEGVRVLPVTKTVEPARILPLKDAGAAEIGENRVQEALEKMPFSEFLLLLLLYQNYCEKSSAFCEKQGKSADCR